MKGANIGKAAELLERIKDVISQDIPHRGIFLKDVANALGIHPTTLVTMKHRGVIPYEQVIEFCAKRKININYMFYQQSIQTLSDFQSNQACFRGGCL